MNTTAIKSVHSLRFVAVALLASAGLALPILHWGDTQYPSVDGSVLVNAAWQLHLGYRPYADIITGAPPLFLIGCRLAFGCWGVQWHSFVIVTALFSTISCLLQVAILRRLKWDRLMSLLLAIAIQCMTVVPAGWWWYNMITAVMSCLFLSTALLLCQQPRSIFAQIVFLVSAALLALSKPNVAGLELLLVFVVLVSLRHMRVRALLLFGGAAILALVILFAVRANPRDLLACYREVGGRPLRARILLNCMLLSSRRETLLTSLLTIPLILAVISVFSRVRRLRLNGKTDVSCLLLGLIGIGTGVWGIMTNHEFNLNDTAVILLATAALVLHFKPSLANPRTRLTPTGLLVISAIAFSASGLMWGALRLRAKAGKHFHGTLLNQSGLTRLEEPPLFRGMRAGPTLVRVLNEIKETLADNGFLVEQPVLPAGSHSPPGRSSAEADVFFSPDISFAYAAYGLRPHPGLPLWWWDIYVDDGPGQTEARIERFKAARFRLCVFERRESALPSGLPQPLSRYLTESYDVFQTDELTVFVRRTQHSAAMR